MADRNVPCIRFLAGYWRDSKPLCTLLLLPMKCATCERYEEHFTARDYTVEDAAGWKTIIAAAAEIRAEQAA
jgi:hypothetical protein